MIIVFVVPEMAFTSDRQKSMRGRVGTGVSGCQHGCGEPLRLAGPVRDGGSVYEHPSAKRADPEAKIVPVSPT